nr:hypothetical protein [Escherichia coli]
MPEGVIRTDDERTHRYHYDSQHRLVHYTRTQYAEPLVESRYLYDPLGRRVAKRVAGRHPAGAHRTGHAGGGTDAHPG